MKSHFQGGGGKRGLVLVSQEHKGMCSALGLLLTSEIQLEPAPEERPALTSGY